MDAKRGQFDCKLKGRMDNGKGGIVKRMEKGIMMCKL